MTGAPVVDGEDLTEMVSRLVDGPEVGLQVCAVVDGVSVVDICAGYADRHGRELTPESLFPVFSVTKGITTAAVTRLQEQGLIDIDAPLTESWPGFGRHGKDGITLRHVLTHRAGLPLMPEGVTPEQMSDWSWMVSALQEATPLWRPGSTVGYHAYTFGWLVGEPMLQAVGGAESAGALVRELVAEPLGAENFWIGLPEEHFDRVVTVYKEEPHSRTPLILKAIPSQVGTRQEVFGRPDVLGASLLGAGAMTNARSLAVVYAALAREASESEGESHPALAAAVTPDRDDLDEVIGAPVPRGLGFYVSGDNAQGAPFRGGRHVFGHPGAGGSCAWADVELGAGFAITRNRLGPKSWLDPEMQELMLTLDREVREHYPAREVNVKPR